MGYRKFVHWSISVLAVLVVAGCGASEQSKAPPFQVTSDVHNLMVWMLEPAADVLWDSAGYVITVEGEQDLQPTTSEGWDHVRNNAMVVAEVGNLLMLPGYAAPEEDWLEYSQALIKAGMRARDAAQAKDADALFEAGALLYSVCLACHQKYIVAAQ